MSEQGWHVHPDGYAHDDSLSQCLAIGCLPLTFDQDDLARLASESRALAEAIQERDSAQEHLAYHLRDFRPGADMEATGDLAVDMAAFGERMRAERDALRERLAAVRALVNEPGVRHLQPPNWRDRVLAALGDPS